MNVIINGGTRGIGRETAIRLSQNTANFILVTGRNREAVNELSSAYSNISGYNMDISEFEKHIESFTRHISEELKHVDILINMAGYLVSQKFEETSSNDARLIMETNFFGPSLLIKAIKPFMKKGSHIVNIASMGGFQGSSKYSGLSYYSASKAALASLSECLALEFAPAGISVNCLALGAVNTEMLKEAFPGYNAPVNSKDMAEYIADFAINGHRFYNGKVLPVAMSNP